MAGPEFFQTMMGKTFFESTMPRLVKALERVAMRFDADCVMTEDTARAQAEHEFWEKAFLACLHYTHQDSVDPVVDAKVRADDALEFWKKQRAKTTPTTG